MSSSPLHARAHTQVLLLLWHDPGVMGTHYAETQAYFRGTAVTCVPVSSTQLTLPTNREVSISAVDLSFKKNKLQHECDSAVIQRIFHYPSIETSS